MLTRHKAEIDRLTELANVGAGHAASAFAQLVGRSIWIEVPVVVEGDSSTASNAPASRPTSDELRTCTGVFFEMEGCLDALVGLLLPDAASEALVRRIVGIDSGQLEAPLIESALMEVGNILASHVASAIADTLRGRLLPSVPALAMQDGERAYSAYVEDRLGPDAVRIESRLRDESGELHGLLLLVPARWSSAASAGLPHTTPKL